MDGTEGFGGGNHAGWYIDLLIEDEGVRARFRADQLERFGIDLDDEQMLESLRQSKAALLENRLPWHPPADEV